MTSSYSITKFRSIWQINIIKTFEVSKQLSQISSITKKGWDTPDVIQKYHSFAINEHVAHRDITMGKTDVQLVQTFLNLKNHLVSVHLIDTMHSLSRVFAMIKLFELWSLFVL